MRTLVISDLHLGHRQRHDVLRVPAALARLLDALDDIDRLVLLGDILEARSRRGVAAAEPVLRAIGRRLGPGREVIVVPGNHDARLTRRWVLAQGRRLTPATAVDPAASRTLARLLSWLSPARARASYPGVWLGDSVWATHGHYLDRHLMPESAFGVRRRLLPTGHAEASPIDYERRRRPQRSGENPAARVLAAPAGGVRRTAGGVLGVVVPRLPGLLMRSGLAPVTAAALDLQMRHQALPAMARVVRRLGVEADWVLFGHVHHRGPIDDGPWTDGDGSRYANTGSWLYEAVLIDRATPPHPYWPGGALLLQDGAAPRSVGLLDELSAAQLRPGAGVGAASR